MTTRTMVRGQLLGARARRLLAAGLLGVAAVICIRVDLVLFGGYPLAVDAEIPLRAVDRWLSGAVVYDPAAFNVTGGPDLPFLYPPAVLPVLSPLLALPRSLVLAVWLTATLLAAVVGLRRLGLGWIWVGAMLLWPPFVEAALGGNVQLLIFAAFVFLFYPRPASADPLAVARPSSVDLGTDSRNPVLVGTLAAGVASIKVSHAQAFAHLLARRPSAAAAGLAVAAGIALVTLLVTGPQLWLDWLAQAGRSGDPAWKPVGMPLSTIVGRPLALGVTIASVVAAMLVRGPRAGAWVGLLTVIGSPSVHLFGFVFLVPAILSVPTPIGLVALTLVATGGAAGAWTGVLILAVTLLSQSFRRSSRAAEVALPA